MSSKTELYLTRDEAVKYIKNKYRKGVTYFVRGGSFLYTTTPEEVVESVEARGFDLTCSIEVSQKAAIKYVKGLFGDHFAELGCKIRISDHPEDWGGCMFIG